MAIILLILLAVIVFGILPWMWQRFLKSERGRVLCEWHPWYARWTVTLGPCKSGGKKVKGIIVDRRLATHWDYLDHAVGVGRHWDYKLPEEDDNGKWWMVYGWKE